MVINQPKFPSYFADAESTYKNSEYVLFGMAYDKTSSFRFGAEKGPDAIRHASWNLESYDMFTGIDFSQISVHDYGNIEGLCSLEPVEMIKKVSSFSNRLFSDKKIPIGIGGEHECTSGITSTVPSDCHFMVFDAHLDYRDSYENEKFNHACTIRRIADYIDVENISVIGVRSSERDELNNAKKDGLNIYTSLQIRKQGMENIIKEIMRDIDSKPIYLSLDIDVIDPAFAPGTGTPEPFGLHPLDICTCFDDVSSDLIGFDVMEVNPLFDHGQTAMLAARYIRYCIEKMSESKH